MEEGYVNNFLSDKCKLSICLSPRGNDVYRGFTVQDSESEISWALTLALNAADLIVTTGGLGPTYDDITVQSIAKALGLKLIEDPTALEIIKKKIYRTWCGTYE